MKEHSILTLFPVPLYMSEIDIDDKISNMLKSEKFSRLQVDNGDSSNDKFILKNPKYQSLAEEIMRHVEIYVRDELKVSDKIQFRFTNSWVMRHKKGDHSLKHNHSNSILSGIVYLDVTSDSGAIHFERAQTYCNLFPACIDLDFSEHNSTNAKEVVIIPVNNQILLFPSHLEHTVKHSKSDRLRYCLAFNLFPKGKIGVDTLFGNLELG